MCAFLLADRIWDTTEAWWWSICMQLANILKYEDKSPRLASWQHRLCWERANKLTTCRTSTVGPSWGKLERAAPQTTGTRRRGKKKAVKATIKGNWSGSPFQSHPVRVLDCLFIFFIGGIWFSKTPSGHTLGVWMALFHAWLSSKSKVWHRGLFFKLCSCLFYALWHKPVRMYALFSRLLTNILYLMICVAAWQIHSLSCETYKCSYWDPKNILFYICTYFLLLLWSRHLFKKEAVMSWNASELRQ